MAFEEYDEYEQSELVQKWLRENGVSIIVGIAIGLVGIFGWQQWRNHQARNEAQLRSFISKPRWPRSRQAGVATTLTDALIRITPIALIRFLPSATAPGRN